MTMSSSEEENGLNDNNIQNHSIDFEDIDKLANSGDKK